MQKLTILVAVGHPAANFEVEVVNAGERVKCSECGQPLSGETQNNRAYEQGKLFGEFIYNNVHVRFSDGLRAFYSERHSGC
jgi:hypothetical protein